MCASACVCLCVCVAMCVCARACVCEHGIFLSLNTYQTVDVYFCVLLSLIQYMKIQNEHHALIALCCRNL